jgi:hypothetical protein
MTRLKFYKSSILPALLLFLSILLIILEYYDLSIIVLLLTLIRIHHISRNPFLEDSNTISNPLVILIPIFIFTQSFYWIIYILNKNGITIFNYSWEIPYMIDIMFLPKSFAIFLLLSSTYIFALSLSYNQKRSSQLRTINYELPKNGMLYFMLSLLVIISILYYIYGNIISIPIGITHFLKVLGKLRVLFSTILIFYLLNKKSIIAKMLLAMFLAIYISLGILSVFIFEMRMILFEPLIIILILIFIKKKRLKFSTLYRLGLFLVACFFVFSFTTRLKFIKQYNEDPNFTVLQKMMHSVDNFSSRGAAYFSDIVAYSNPNSINLFETKKYYIFTEIIYGLPLGSIFVPKRFTYTYPFDMEFFWSYNPNGISSSYVSAPSALLFTLGLPIAMLVLFFVGIFQGTIFSYFTYQIGSKCSWFIIHPMLVPFYMNGLAKTDLLGLLAYSFIAYWVLKYLILRKYSQILY